MEEMLLFQVTCVAVLIVSMYKGQLASNTCNVFPKDPYIHAGSDTVVVCQASCAPGRIYWTLNSKRLDESLSHSINSSHSELSLRNFTESGALLECHSEDIRQVLGGTIIRTYSKPSEIWCTLHYRDQSYSRHPQLFTCKWERMNTSLRINYTVLISSSYMDQTEICSSQRNTCTTKNTGNILLYENINVTLRAKTSVWEANSDPREFYPHNILKIIPPKFNVCAESDHLSIDWKHSMCSKGCRCQVKYSETVNGGNPETVLSQPLARQHRGRVLEKVESCRNYSVWARCALENAPWSDWSSGTSVLTRLNKTEVRLNLWRTISKPDKNEVRKVHVMWKGIPSTCQGNFTYSVKQISYQENMTGVQMEQTLCRNSPCVVDVSRDTHRINLTVLLNEALLAEDSVYIPTSGESLPEVTGVQASAVEGVIVVRWTAPVQPVSGYMIDWTCGGNRYDWKQTEYTNMTLSDLLEKRQYNITVTPLFGDGTGPGSEAPHVCSSFGDPGNVTVDVQAYDKSADVRWETRSQEECSGTIINYTVFYSAEEGPTLNLTVSSTMQEVFLKDLDPDTQYSVFLAATALTGTSKSDYKHFKTKRFDPRLITVLGVSGTIVIILVCTLGPCCILQWKKFKERKVPDPSLSSLAQWPSPDHQKLMCAFHDFGNPESICDPVYTEEMQNTHSHSPPATDCNGNLAREGTEEYAAPDSRMGKVVELAETQLQSSGESAALLSAENNAHSPYRSQSAVETPALRSSKPNKHVPVKQQEKLEPVTVYVTLNMIEHGQGR